MTTSLIHLPARVQEPIHAPPYDTWVTPEGAVTAEFHRTAQGYLVRFPDQVDFEIDATSFAVRCAPIDGARSAAASTLFRNSVQPIIANHTGGLNLHGSAVCIGDTAAAFLGVSRRGKTTLAGAFAAAGHPFLTEDVLALERSGDGFLIRPSMPELRLFHDSASFLLGGNPGWDDPAEKSGVPASEALPYRDEALPLGGIFILGPGASEAVSLTRLTQASALAELIQHSFILDVEDRARLKSHFQRMGVLAQAATCYLLDYPRTYSELPKVIDAIVDLAENDRCERGA